MADYTLQFKPEDITAKFCEAYRFPSVKKNAFAGIEAHALTSPISGLPDGLMNLLNGSDHSQRLEHAGQRAILKTLPDLPYQLEQKSTELMREFWKPELDATSIDSLAEEYYALATALIRRFPLTPALTAMGALTPEQEGLIERMDSFASLWAYNQNRLFAATFKRQQFYLHEDMRTFSVETAEAFRSHKLESEGGIQQIATKADYLTYAILPLFWNVIEHAFNPAHDVLGRASNGADFKRTFVVRGRPEIYVSGAEGELSPAQSGLYIVTVSDNGLGISPDVLHKLFEKGATSRAGASSGHGIGLWGVRQFVEQHGGTITVETELGKGTEFKFTIPYSTLDHKVCIQS